MTQFSLVIFYFPTLNLISTKSLYFALQKFVEFLALVFIVSLYPFLSIRISRTRIEKFIKYLAVVPTVAESLDSLF